MLRANLLSPNARIAISGAEPARGDVPLFSFTDVVVFAAIRVALIERTAFQHWRVGDAIPPEARVQLSRLGVWEPFLAENHSPSVEMRWTWGSENPVDYNFMLNPYGSAWHVDRQKFDLLLFRAARKAGADTALSSTVKAIERADDHWKVTVVQNDRLITLTCQFVVDSTGQSAWVARSLGIKGTPIDRLWGTIAICEPERDVQPLLVVEAVENGWWYSSPISSRRLLVCFMSDLDLAVDFGVNKSLWMKELKRSTYTRKRLGPLNLTDPIRRRPAVSRRLDHITGRGWLAVGDAASSFDPLSGSGIYKALVYAPLAANAVKGSLNGDHASLERYAKTVRQDFSRYLSQRAAKYREEQRWPNSSFWLRRHLDAEQATF